MSLRKISEFINKTDEFAGVRIILDVIHKHVTSVATVKIPRRGAIIWVSSSS